MKSGLIIFIRNPVKGKVKTRLAKTMGDEKAFLIYNQLLLHTHLITRDLSYDKFLYYSDHIDPADMWNNNQYQKRLQTRGDLGERMSTAFRDLFLEGYERLLIIGSDCMELKESIICKAFDMLNVHRVIIGPSEDGGYYLLGMTTPLPGIFVNKKWGTPSVFADTVQDLLNTGIMEGRLETLKDIDEEKDIPGTLLQLISHQRPT